MRTEDHVKQERRRPEAGTHPGCRLHRLQPAWLPRGRRGRGGPPGRDEQGRRLLPLPDQGVALPASCCARPPTGWRARWSGPWPASRTPSTGPTSPCGPCSSVFAGHRTMARLFLIDAVGAGPAFQAELQRHPRALQRPHRRAARDGGRGGHHPAHRHGRGRHGLVRRAQRGRHALAHGRATRPARGRLPTLRALLLRSVGIPEARIAALEPVP